MPMASIRGTREGAAVVTVPDMIAASLVARGEAEYVTDEQGAGEGAVKGGGTGKRRATRSATRGTGRQSGGRGSSAGNGGA